MATVIDDTAAPALAPKYDLRRLPRNSRVTWVNLKRRWAHRDRKVAFPTAMLAPIALLALLALIAFPFDEVVARSAKTWPSWVAEAASQLTHLSMAGLHQAIALALLIVLGSMALEQTPPGRFNMLSSRISFLYLIILSLLFSEIASSLLKFGVGRARPAIIDMYGMNTLRPLGKNSLFASFPSGHSTDIATIATVLALTFWKWRYVFGAAAVLLGLTRVAVLKHFPSDVFGGLALGVLCGAAAVTVFAQLRYIFRRSATGNPAVKPSFRLFDERGHPVRKRAN